jgi:hypothetical protein
VKYPKPVIGNDIIQDFNQVRLSVKNDKQVFIFGIGIVFVKKKPSYLTVSNASLMSISLTLCLKVAGLNSMATLMFLFYPKKIGAATFRTAP